MSGTTFAPPGAVRRHALRGAVVLSAAALALTLTAGSAPMASQVAAATGCAGAEADFNGDGIRDTAIADNDAPVNGVSKAGVVHIVYGGGKGTFELTQESAKAGSSEAGDGFGYSLAVYDADLDGCADLAIGIPYEDVGGRPDAGRAVVVYGSPAGLAAGRASIQYLQGTAPLSGAAEAYDWTGYSLAAGKSSTGVSFLAIGAPGEDLGTTPDAGGVIYVSGSSAVSIGIINQDTATAGAVPDTAEPYDRFGTSIAATPTHLAISAPGEAQGSIVDAGAVTVFSHTLVSGVPTPLYAITQDSPNVYGTCETGDAFGTSIAAVPYRAEGATSTTESLLVVGIPGEERTTTQDSGGVEIFRLDAAGGYQETAFIDQATTGVSGTATSGDHFGQRVVAVNTAPDSVSTPENTRMAVGIPGKESTTGVVDRGQVQILPLVGPPGDSDVLLGPGYGMPTPAATRQYAGMSLGSSTAGLYVGLPYGPATGRAVYLFPWNVGNAGAPVQTFKPGAGGIPAGTSSFGTAVR
ncbi:FG-GAP repeat domain-containing protein [Streptomyces vinaceus]|uniref:FG-GAP repeat domain-containing protein n=1 Tax=Streptomyces vinaceus TaxID=1960 RepID=UPI0035E179FF